MFQIHHYVTATGVDLFAGVGKTILLLLCGGDKRTQRRDIENAKTYFKDYQRRTQKARPGKRAT